MDNLSQESKTHKAKINAWYLFGVTLTIILLFGWYFFFHVKENENEEIQHSFRVLNQIGINTNARYNSYNSLLENLSIYIDVNDSIIYDFNDLKLIQEFLAKYNTDTSLGLTKEDSTYIKNVLQRTIRYIKQTFPGIEAVDTNTQNTSDKEYYYFLSRKFNLTVFSADTIYWPQHSYYVKYNPNEIQIDLSKFGLVPRIRYVVFFKQILREDIFDGLFLLHYQDVENKIHLEYNSFVTSMEIEKLDSNYLAEKGLRAGKVCDVVLNNTEYKLFIQPLSLGGGKYYIGAVTEIEKFKERTRRISRNVATVTLILFLLSVFTLPLIKLKMLSINSQLKSADLLYSAASIFLISTFLILLLLILKQKIISDNQINSNLTSLSNSIQNSFEKEVFSHLATLDTFRNKYKQINAIPDTAAINVLKLQNKNLKMIFRLSDEGKQTKIISTRKKKDRNTDLSFRDYYKKSGEWKISTKNKSYDFVLDVIVSNTTGERLCAVSVKNEDNTVDVVTSRFPSVINTMLPPGYGFAIIDKQGQVWFHSDKNKIKQENLLDETRNDENLKSSLFSHMPAEFKCKYQGENHIFNITSLSTIPLYLITFHNKEFSNSILLEATSLTAAPVLINLILVLVIITLIWSFRRRESTLKRHNDFYVWIRPQAANFNLYLTLTITNVVSALILFAISLLVFQMHLYFLLLVLIFNQLFFGYKFHHSVEMILDKIRFYTGAFVPVLFGIITLIFAFTNNLLDKTEIFLFLFLTIFMALCNNTIFNYLKKIANQSAKKFISLNPQPSIYYFYLLSWVLLLVFVPIIVFNNIVNYQEQKLTAAHELYSYANEKSEREYEIKKFAKEKLEAAHYISWKEETEKGIYYPGILDDPAKENNYNNFWNSRLSLCGIFDNSINSADKILFEIWQINKKTNPYLSSRNSLGYSSPYNQKVQFNYYNNTVKLAFVNLVNRKNSSNTTSVLYRYKIVDSNSDGYGLFFLFTLLSAVILVSIYYLIKAVSNKLFGINNANTYNRIKLKRLDFKTILCNHIEYKKNILLQLPQDCFDINLPKLENYLERSLTTISNDLSNCKFNKPDASQQIQKDVETIIVDKKKYSGIFINEFEIHSNDIFVESKIIAQLTDFMKKHNTPIIIKTTCSFEKFLDDVDGLLETNKDETSQKSIGELKDNLLYISKTFIHLYAPISETKTEASDAEIEKLLNRPTTFLSKMRISFSKTKQLFGSRSKLQSKKEETSTVQPHYEIIELKKILNSEISVSCKLKALEQELVNYLERLYSSESKACDKLSRKEKEEKLISKIKEVAASHYQRILDGCSHDEKIILFDLADDMLVNYKNSSVIKILLKKGLIENTWSFEPMNRSFREFLITRFEDESERAKVEKYRIKEKWLVYRAPIMLVILALAVFIAFQQNILNSLTSIVSTLIGGIAVISKFTGLLTFSKSLDKLEPVN